MKKPPRTIEPPVGRKKARGPGARLARFTRAADVPAPSREEARRRIRSKPGFFESLDPEGRSTIADYDGPEVIGPPGP
jgi:hypothetical protein